MMKQKLIFAVYFSFCLISSVFAQEETVDADFQQRARLLTAYIQVKDTYAEKDVTAFKEALDIFRAEVKILRLKGLVFEDMARLKKVRDSLRNDAEVLSEISDIAAAKERLSSMGSHMWALVEKMKFNEQPVYLQYCPMEDAYWISEEKRIFNPFSPVIMPTCGSVVQSLSDADYVTEACCH